MNSPTLKKGDQVVMHTCMEHDHPDNFGKIWTCRSDEFQHKGHDYGSVFLEGFSGSFSTEYLQVINLPGVVKRLKEEKDRLQHWQLTAVDAINEKEMYRHKLQDALNTLKWYGDKRNYEEISDGYIPVEKDDGSRARESIDHIQAEQSGGTGE